jgi:hypothetical protein
MANQVYDHFKMHLLSGDIDLAAADIWVLLCSGAYTFSHAHELVADITDEIGSAGYDAGGIQVQNTLLQTGTAQNEGQLQGDDITFSGLTSVLEFGIVWVSGASNYLLGQVDFGSQTLTASDLVITWNTDGIYNLT